MYINVSQQTSRIQQKHFAKSSITEPTQESQVRIQKYEILPASPSFRSDLVESLEEHHLVQDLRLCVPYASLHCPWRIYREILKRSNKTNPLGSHFWAQQ